MLFSSISFFIFLNSCIYTFGGDKTTLCIEHLSTLVKADHWSQSLSYLANLLSLSCVLFVSVWFFFENILSSQSSLMLQWTICCYLLVPTSFALFHSPFQLILSNVHDDHGVFGQCWVHCKGFGMGVCHCSCKRTCLSKVVFDVDGFNYWLMLIDIKLFLFFCVSASGRLQDWFFQWIFFHTGKT